jgi:hypothetical protein
MDPFVNGDYRPSVLWFSLVDRAAFTILAVAQRAWPSGSIRQGLTAAVTWSTATIVIALLLWLQPYPVHVRWKGMVRLGSLLLCALVAALNITTSLHPDSPAVIAMAYLAVIGSVALFATLVIAFLVDVVPPKAKPQPPAAIRAARLSLAPSAATENPLLLQSTANLSMRKDLTSPSSRLVGAHARVVYVESPTDSSAGPADDPDWIGMATTETGSPGKRRSILSGGSGATAAKREVRASVMRVSNNPVSSTLIRVPSAHRKKPARL